jgi:hypothetical protein
MGPQRIRTDEKPGPLPDIRLRGDDVIFVVHVDAVFHGARLVLRCEPNGNVWASISQRTKRADSRRLDPAH